MARRTRESHMSSNWTSGQTNYGSNTSTTQKYFNPQAIIDQLNKYSQQLGGTSALNDQILYGKGAKPGTAGPYSYTAPPATPAPAAQTPATAPPAAPPATTPATTPGTTPATTPGATTPGTGAANPTAGGPGTSGTNPVGTGPENPRYQDPILGDVKTGTPTSYGETPASGTDTVVRLASGAIMDIPAGGTIPDGASVMSGPGGPTAGTGPGVGDPGTTTPTDPGVDPTQGTSQHKAATPLPGGQPVTPTGTTPTDASSGSGLLDVIQQLIDGGGYSDAEKSAIQEKAAEADAAQKASAQAQMANHLASSGNAAGYSGAMSSLDNSAAQTASDQARQNTIDFANEAERRKELGQSALQQIYGVNTASNIALMGQASGLSSLGGGTDTSTSGGSDFSHQGFQGTPDSSAKPTTGTGAKPSAGAGTPGTGGSTPPAGTPPGVYETPPDSTGKTYWVDPATGKVYDPNGTLVHDPNNPTEPYWDPFSGTPDPGTTDPGQPAPGDPGTTPDPGTTDPGQPAPGDPGTGDPGTGDPSGGGDGSLYDPLAALKRLLSTT